MCFLGHEAARAPDPTFTIREERPGLGTGSRRDTNYEALMAIPLNPLGGLQNLHISLSDDKFKEELLLDRLEAKQPKKTLIAEPTERPRSAVIIPFPRNRIKRIVIKQEIVPDEASHPAPQSA
jgi:hypothetical protein